MIVSQRKMNLSPLKFIAMFFLFTGLVGTLAAYSKDAMAAPTSNTQTVQAFEQYLNEGKVAQALALFSDGAVVLEAHPGEIGNNQTSGYYTPGGYYIPRAYSAGASETYHKGQDKINTFLSSLVSNKFQSNNSTYREDTGGVTWQFENTGKLKFRAGFQDGKIVTLIATVY